MKRTLYCMLIFVLAFPLMAQQFGQVGTTGAQLLKINFDPRASALGYAATSAVDNASAIYTNVAGLEGIKSFDAAFSYTPWFANIKMASVVAALRIPDVGVVGVQAAGFSTDEEVTTNQFENGTGERFTIRMMEFGLSFARSLTDRLAIGLQAKVINESYYGHATTGIAFDIGSMYNLGFLGSRLAMTLRHFGPDLPAIDGTYSDYSDGNIQKDLNQTPLPVTFHVSYSMEPYVTTDYRVRLIAELIHPNDNVEHYNIGSEALLFDVLALRAGLKLNYDDESFAVGIGLRGDQFLGQNIRLDYSYEHFGVLPSIHKIAVGFAIE
jgi:hypothetical protein